MALASIARKHWAPVTYTHVFTPQQILNNINAQQSWKCLGQCFLISLQENYIQGIQQEMSILLEMTVEVIKSEKVHKNACPILNGWGTMAASISYARSSPPPPNA
jgi:hypothetical protein